MSIERSPLFYSLPGVRELEHQDSWLRSSENGNYLLLRGMCFGPSAKLSPYLPFKQPEDWERFESYIDLLLACGFTTLRVPFLWSAFEPVCDPQEPIYDEAYIEQFFDYLRKFSDKGFLLFIDLHQDLVGKAFGGNGLPGWVMAEGARERSFLRNTPLWGLNYVLNRHLRRTFTEFWQNDLTNSANIPPLHHFKVRDRFLDCIERIAEHASHNTRVIGIEIFNEPHPAMLQDKRFEEEILPAFYGAALERIRRHSSDLYAFVSPQSDWNVNVRADKRYESYIATFGDDPRVAFAYHYYDSLLTGLHGLHFHDAKRDEYLDAQRIGVEQARRKGMLPFLTEFGTRQNWRGSIVRQHMNWQFESVERSLTNATYWNVNLYNTEQERDGFMREDFSLIDHDRAPRNLDVATRPYVQSASSEPVHMHFNLRTKEFELTLRGAPLDTETLIYVPATALHPMQPVHYPKEILMEHQGVKGAELSGNMLRIRLDPSRDEHHIRLIDPAIMDPQPDSNRIMVRSGY